MARGKYNIYAAQCRAGPHRRQVDGAHGWLARRAYAPVGQLCRRIEGISHKVLVQTLRSLERDGLVHRQPHATTPPTVEYALTPLESTLVELLASIREWAEQHIEEFQAARDAYKRERSLPVEDN